MDIKTVLVVCGTKKSERAGGLDAGEVSSFTIEPGQYDSNIKSPSDLIEHIDRNAYLRGEWISSFQINGVDVVEKIVAETVSECHENVDDILHSLLEMGMFCNADIADLQIIVTKLMNVQ